MRKLCDTCGTVHDDHQAHVFSNQPVTNTKPICNHCVTKDAEIARLRNQLATMAPKPPKRNRAEYMRDYRKSKVGTLKAARECSKMHYDFVQK